MLFKRSAHSAWPTQWRSGRVGQGSSIIEFVPGLPCKLFSSFALVVLFVCSFVCLFYLLWLTEGVNSQMLIFGIKQLWVWSPTGLISASQIAHFGVPNRCILEFR